MTLFYDLGQGSVPSGNSSSDFRCDSELTYHYKSQNIAGKLSLLHGDSRMEILINVYAEDRGCHKASTPCIDLLFFSELYISFRFAR